MLICFWSFSGFPQPCSIEAKNIKYADIGNSWGTGIEIASPESNSIESDCIWATCFCDTYIGNTGIDGTYVSSHKPSKSSVWYL